MTNIIEITKSNIDSLDIGLVPYSDPSMKPFIDIGFQQEKRYMFTNSGFGIYSLKDSSQLSRLLFLYFRQHNGSKEVMLTEKETKDKKEQAVYDFNLYNRFSKSIDMSIGPITLGLGIQSRSLYDKFNKIFTDKDRCELKLMATKLLKRYLKDTNPNMQRYKIKIGSQINKIKHNVLR